MKAVRKLDIGEGVARSACVTGHFLLVGNISGVHIFALKQNFNTVSEHSLGGESLSAMCLFKSGDEDNQQLVVCGTSSGEVFLVKTSDDA